MCESKELFCSVLVSMQEPLIDLCSSYLSLAQETDNIIKELEKITIKKQARKVN